MFEVRQLRNKSRWHICTENVFKNYHFSKGNDILSPKKLRSNIKNLDRNALQDTKLDPKDLSPKEKKRIYNHTSILNTHC